MRVLGALALQTGDVSSPSIPQSVVATAINAGRVDVSWTASTDDTAVTGYQIFRNGSPLTTTTLTSYSDTTCQPSTAYSYVIVAFDAAGNNSTASNAGNATTPANAAPVWQTIPTQSVIVGNSYLLQLTDYCTDADLDTITFAITAGTLPSGLALSGNRIQGTATTAGEARTVTVRASDPFHQISTSITFNTYTADVTAPPVPTGLGATAVSSSRIDLSWSASTDASGGANQYVSGTKDYRIYQSTDGTNFLLRTTVTGLSYSDTSLSSSTIYYYKITARDNALNESAQTSAVNATTSAAGPPTADWIARSTASGVIWAHDFQQDNELYNFVRGENTSGDGVSYTNPFPRPPGSLTLVSTPFGSSRAIRSKAFGTTLTAAVPAASDYPAHDTQIWPVANAADIPDPAGSPYRILVGNGTDSGGIEWVEVQSINTGANTITVKRKMTAENGGYGTNTAPSFPSGFTLGRGPNGSWNRPFGAFPSTQNGKSTADIGIANGTVTKQRAWGGGTQNSATHANFREAYFGHRFYWDNTQPTDTGPAALGGLTPGSLKNWTPQDGGGVRNDAWDGDELWLQFRAKISATRFNAPLAKMLFIQNASTSGSGQFFWTVGGNRYGEQPPPSEKRSDVTYGTYAVGLTSYADSAAPAGGILGSVQTDSIDNNLPIQDGYPNSKYANRPSNFLAWCFPADRWVTYLVHFKFGKDNARPDPSDTLPSPTAPFAASTDATYRTTYEFYVAEEGDSTYKLITNDTNWIWFFGDGKDSAGTYYYNAPGLNTFWMSQNLNDYIGAGSVSPPFAPHSIDYTQAILSKNTIPVPNDAPDYIYNMAAFEAKALTPVSNGVSTYFNAASAAWRANPALVPPGGSDSQSLHLQKATYFSGGFGDGLRGFVYLEGGGHGDSAYNGIIKFDFNGTTQAAGFSVVPNTESTPSTAGASSGGSLYPDGKAASIHSYDHFYFDAPRNIRYRHGGSVWSGSGGASIATFKFDFNTNTQTQLANQPALFDLGCCTIGDPGSDKFYTCRQNNVSHFYRSASNSWASAGSFFTGGGFSFTACLDTKRSRFIVVGQNSGFTRKDLANISWSTDTISGITTFTPTGDACPLFNDEGVGICYDKLLDCYWLFGGRATTFDHIYRMNASTFAVTAYPLSQTIPTGADYFGCWKRFMFQENWRAIGVVISYNQPVYVIRLPSV